MFIGAGQELLPSVTMVGNRTLRNTMLNAKEAHLLHTTQHHVRNLDSYQEYSKSWTRVFLWTFPRCQAQACSPPPPPPPPPPLFLNERIRTPMQYQQQPAQFTIIVTVEAYSCMLLTQDFKTAVLSICVYCRGLQLANVKLLSILA